MIEPPKPEHPEAKSLGGWLKRNFLSTLMFVVVIAVMVALFIFQDKIARLQNWGYLGAFIISITANATVVCPCPALSSSSQWAPLLIHSTSGWRPGSAVPWGK
jgi:Na+-translocating ferredoxin:NAD+ oxidoreductase RnfA subunit